MPNYHRWYKPGGTYFFTVVTYQREPILISDLARRLLREAFADCQAKMPLKIPAIVLLPNHIHAIWTLPEGDEHYSQRWAIIKRAFTHQFLESGGMELPISADRTRRRGRGVWQERFWEHTIQSQADFVRHVDYIHYNPVKHGLVSCVHCWPYSTFHLWVKGTMYPRDWYCSCAEDTKEIIQPPKFDDVDETAME